MVWGSLSCRWGCRFPRQTPARLAFTIDVKPKDGVSTAKIDEMRLAGEWTVCRSPSFAGPRPCGPTGSRAPGVPLGVAEVFENESWYIEENIRTYSTDPDAQTIVPDAFGGPIVLAEGYQTLGDYNLMESLNGFVYGNLDGLTMRVGERVRWYIMATTNFELHTPHWHGNVVTIGNQRTDVASQYPASAARRAHAGRRWLSAVLTTWRNLTVRAYRLSDGN